MVVGSTQVSFLIFQRANLEAEFCSDSSVAAAFVEGLAPPPSHPYIAAVSKLGDTFAMGLLQKQKGLFTYLGVAMVLWRVHGAGSPFRVFPAPRNST